MTSTNAFDWGLPETRIRCAFQGAKPWSETNSGKTQRFAASRGSVEYRSSDRDVIGLVVTPGTELIVVIDGDHHVGARLAYRCGDVAPQVEVVTHDPVRIVEEIDRVYPDQRGTGDLLLHAQRTAHLRWDRVDAGLTMGDKQIADLLALRGPAGDR